VLKNAKKIAFFMFVNCEQMAR